MHLGMSWLQLRSYLILGIFFPAIFEIIFGSNKREKQRVFPRKDLRSEGLALSAVLIMVYVLQQVAYLLWTWCPHLSNGGINKFHLVE